MTGARALILLTAIVATSVVAPPRAWAELDESEAVEAADQTLGGWAGFSWYDSTREDSKVRLVPVRSFEPPPAPKAWQQQSSQSTWWQDLLRAIGNFLSKVWEFLSDYRVFSLIAIVIIVVVLILVLRNFKGTLQVPTGGSRGTSKRAKAEIDRIEALPFKVAPPTGDLLSEAQRRYDEGDYRGAVIYYYSYQLVELDKHQKIRLARGKTNRQYLREVRQRRELAGILEETMVRFEEVFFGDHELSRARFDQCWSLCANFQQMVTVT